MVAFQLSPASIFDAANAAAAKIKLKDTFGMAMNVADAALYFAASKSNALTGQSLPANHGWFMQ